MKTKPKQRAVFRSAKTGRYVTAAYAKRHPSTTVQTKVKACRPASTRKPA
jgi:hypothetical protein